MRKIVWIGVLVAFVLSACGAVGTSVSDQVETQVPPSTATAPPSSDALEGPQAPTSSPWSATWIGYSSVAQALADLKSKDDVIVEVSKGWTTVTEAGGLTIRSFAPSTHPAYRAVAKRDLFQDQEGWKIKMDILCEADKAACDQFARDFEILNEQRRQYIEQQKRP